MNEVLRVAERALSHAREALRQEHETAGPCLKAVGIWLKLFDLPSYGRYNAAALLKEHEGEFAGLLDGVDVEPVPLCEGDTELILECLLVLLRAAQREEDARLFLELFEEKEEPRIALSFDGPGCFPDPLPLHGSFGISLEELGARWTWATRGGRIDKIPGGLLLRLKARRMLPEPVLGLEPLIAQVRQASEALQAMPAAPDRSMCHLDKALRLIDGEPKAKAATDVAALIEEVFTLHEPLFSHRGIMFRKTLDACAPPLVIERGRLETFFLSALALPEFILHRGGSVEIMTDYSQSERALSFMLVVSGPVRDPCEAVEIASMRRALVDEHEDSLEVSVDAQEVVITGSLPDSVGRALDQWIPGFENFADRSRQMLRLLKGPGPAPPQEFILPGVLDEELVRWLMPFYESPAVRNLSHDLKQPATVLTDASKDRFAKALTQLRKGKPRKEIAKPLYACEVLWAFKGDDRHRKAIGAGRLDEQGVETLCRALLAEGSGWLDSLRLIARAIGDQ